MHFGCMHWEPGINQSECFIQKLCNIMIDEWLSLMLIETVHTADDNFQSTGDLNVNMQCSSSGMT